MLKINYFNYAAVAVLFIILFSAVYRNVGKNSANKAFLVAVVEFWMTTLMDLLAVSLDNLGGGNPVGKIIFHSGYLLLHTVSSLFYLVYLISLTDTWQKFMKKKYRMAAVAAPAVFFLCVVILNLFGMVDLFHLDEADTYTRGTWFVTGYIIGSFYMLLGLIYIVLHRKLFTAKWIITLFAPFPFIAVAMLIQLLRPAIVIEMFFNALALLFVYTNIQKPEELMDPNTQLSNAKAFEDYSRRVFYNGKQTSVVMIDIQNFDVVQDTLSLDGLRAFLLECAQTIGEVSRKLGIRTDTFSGEKGRFFAFSDPRYSDRFEVFVRELAEQFGREAFAKGMELRPHFVFCVISIPEDINDFSVFIRFTSSRLQKLQSEKVHYASELFRDKYYKTMLNINSILADAVKYNHFEVYYQPIYSCRLKRFVSAEALLRLKDPEYGFISPDLFIPAAERSGLIQQISDFVLKSVCSFISGVGFETLGIEYIEVNLSSLECVQSNLQNRVLNCIRDAGIPTSRIALEITETALVYDTEKLMENLFALSKAGIRFCLDDYGTGYSDTRRIVDLPLSIIKLDKSFLDGIERKLNEVIVKDTIRMINDIGNHAVAEGVESEKVLRLLEQNGCDLIQGYFFSKPIPLDEFKALCRQQTELFSRLLS